MSKTTMNNLKKVLLVFLALTFVLAAFGCGPEEQPPVVDEGEKATVKFEANGADAIADVQVSEKGVDSLTLPTPTRAGYDFVGWYLDAELSQVYTADAIKALFAPAETTTGTETTDESAAPAEKVITLYARWYNRNFDAYYHSYESDDLGSVNYWDSKESTVGDLSGYIFNGYWGTQMNEEKDGYDWVCELAKEKPQAVNPDENGLATIYKFEVRVGSELKYNTLSTVEKFAAYRGREVALEDYLTPFKQMYTKANAIERGAEQLEGAGSIKGMAAFYAGTETGFSQELWDAVGIKAYEEDGKAYLEVEFNELTNQFYAMYYLASSLNTPIPQDFLDEIGGLKKYGKFSDDNKLSPVDTCLSTSYYVLESWQFGKEIVFKKNDLFEDNGKYQIPGVYLEVLPAINSDPEAGLKEFLAGRIDAAGIPSTKLNEYKNDDRATTTLDSSTFKLNINSCTMEEWIDLFGVDGTITQTAVEDYWDVKPIMSNDNFLRGLNYCINRKEFADVLGRTPTANYFASNYLSDPENGVAYNSTQAHKDATASILANTDGYGYSLALAKDYFKAACDELIAAGTYAAGDEIHIEICWMDTASIDEMGIYIAKYIQDAFNNCGGGLTIVVDNYACAVWSDVYYAKMMVGQFDLGFGSISGNSLNPLNFLEVLRSDNTSGFTLNWGVDTSIVDDSLTYDGRKWSFNSLWEAADRGALVDPDGNLIKIYDINLLSVTANADGSRTIKFNVGELNTEVATSKLADVVIFGYTGSGADYAEESLEFTVENGIATATATAEQVAKYAATETFGYDCYFEVVANGETSTQYKTVYSNPATDYNTAADEDFKAGEAITMATSGEYVSYVAADYSERTVILGILEKYAVENFLTGLTIYGNGGFVMYQERVNPGTGDWSNYIPGYGFGVLSEGNLLGK